jgi:hypothetical protein
MMNRHRAPDDSDKKHPDPATVYGESEALFKDAITRTLDTARAGRATDDRMSEAALVIGSEAQRRGLPPERMLVAVKSQWSQVAAPWREAAADRYQEAQERLVSHCIKAYYAADAANHG